MTTEIIPTPLNGTSFETAVYQFLATAGVEGLMPYVYADFNGIRPRALEMR